MQENKFLSFLKTNKRKIYMIFILLIAVGVLVSFTCILINSVIPNVPKEISNKTTSPQVGVNYLYPVYPIYEDLNSIQKDSSLVALAKVESIDKVELEDSGSEGFDPTLLPEWKKEGRGFIVTTYNAKIAEVLFKGNTLISKDDLIKIRKLGGKIGEREDRAEEEPMLELNSTYLFFLKQNTDKYSIVGGVEGYYKIDNDVAKLVLGEDEHETGNVGKLMGGKTLNQIKQMLDKI